ncbi:DUF2306 domain-containing protein [Actinophytocola oryzae]|uniref:Putative membrane protein DUF2306 n=1 Tax=Actinophytocola oryzae TaxID=502181 RepID=A0A4R7VYM9_9PSEU|nr:DUF2306 domain-containing protein [Actinophytocola oryzae]TDV54855.1 putative membrane protein DUF2306 [Actinophytocola oryzae]
MTTTVSRPTTRRRWLVPAVLITFSAIPVTAGIVRVGQLVAGGPITEESARFFASPVPLILHIVGATTFTVLGGFQFSRSLRRHRWHRVAGRIVIPAGLVAAAAALWMALFYPKPPGDGALLEVFRLVFGTFMFVALVLGYQAIRRHDVSAHRAWLTRAYLVGIGADTQAVLTGIYVGAVGQPGVTARALLLGGAWVLNLAVAEVIIHRMRRRTP